MEKLLRFGDQDLGFILEKKYEIWSELGPYGSVGAHIKIGIFEKLLRWGPGSVSNPS